MKQLFLFGAVMLLMIACKEQEQRYTQASDEIEAMKGTIADYEQANWESYVGRYADTAKIYHNSEEGITPAQSAEMFKGDLVNYSSYSFVKDKGDVEMVITDDGETWVNYWGVWQGTNSVTNKTYTIPVHVTAQFIDGKIVKEYGYWDTAPLMMAQMEIDAAAKAAADTVAETVETETPQE